MIISGQLRYWSLPSGYLQEPLVYYPFYKTCTKPSLRYWSWEAWGQSWFFAKGWCKREFEEHGLKPSVVQMDISFNRTKGALRGMHYRKPPHQETRLVRCTKGRIFDFAIDLRPESSTFLQWTGVELTTENYRMLHIPQVFWLLGRHSFPKLNHNSKILSLKE